MDKLKAYAKINVGLSVGPRKTDGYHDLLTYFHLISLHDELEVELLDSNVVAVSVVGNEAYLKEGELDLMEKAAYEYAKLTKQTFKLNIMIEKHIPFGGGLGGGSSDAASILLYLENHFKTGIDIFALGQKLGSDIPFFLTGFKAAKGEGRGERLTQIPAAKGSIALLLPNNAHVSTKAAFKALDEREAITLSLLPWNNDRTTWFKSYKNDFLPVQLNSSITSLIDKYGIMLSGSGSSYFVPVFTDICLKELKAEIENVSVIEVALL